MRILIRLVRRLSITNTELYYERFDDGKIKFHILRFLHTEVQAQFRVQTTCRRCAPLGHVGKEVEERRATEWYRERANILILWNLCILYVPCADPRGAYKRSEQNRQSFCLRFEIVLLAILGIWEAKLSSLLNICF